MQSIRPSDYNLLTPNTTWVKSRGRVSAFFIQETKPTKRAQRALRDGTNSHAASA